MKRKRSLLAALGLLCAGILPGQAQASAAYPALSLEKLSVWQQEEPADSPELTPVWDTAQKEEETALEASWQEEALPVRYDAREAGRGATIKSQGSLGTCWALTITSALEAGLLPKEQIVFSADHMSLRNGFNITQYEGGDYIMAMAYLASWTGPVLEEEDPYGDRQSPEGLSAAVHVQEVQMIHDEGLNAIKKGVLAWGGLQTSLYMDTVRPIRNSLYYNEETYGYYYGEQKTPNHDVLIIGWDDEYPAENFPGDVKTDGAYICQNTWGTKFGDEGIFYVSYEDPNIADYCIAYTRIESTDNYDHIYQSDLCGAQGQIGYEADTCYFSNVYTAGGAEELRAVGFYADGGDTTYDVYLVRDFSGPEDLNEREYLQSGTIDRRGYYTIDLEEPVSLEAGERFAVVVKITTKDADYPVSIEYRADKYTEDVILDDGEGYISLKGDSWKRTEEGYSSNVCLKAYTSDR